MSESSKSINSRPNYKRYKMYKFISYAALAAVVLVAASLAFGWLITLLWNATIAEIFGVAEISFWQGIGLFLLAKLFFGFGSTPNKSQSGKFQWAKFRDKSIASRSFKTYWDEEGRAAYQLYRTNRETPSEQDPT